MTHKDIMRKYHGVVYPEDEIEYKYEEGPQDKVFCWDNVDESPITGEVDTRTPQERTREYREYLKKRRGY